MKICPKCGEKFADDANFCPMDASKLVPGPSGVVARPPSTPGAAAKATVLGAAAVPFPPPPPAPRPPPAPPAAPAAVPPPTPGGVISARFVPGPSLGGGASGEVFRARDQQTGAQVALKVVNPAVFPTPIAVERASRELRQLSRVTSERIARIIDFGKAADGRFFVATELIEGVSLQQLVTREGPVPVGRARAFILQIGEALTEAQKAGVIHRDVAPKNVLVTEGDRVRVINFSVPRPVSEKIFGVPEFLSPEQAEGKSVDQRSNIYSLGAILYFLVVGEPPFVGADVRAVCELHMKGTVQPPSARKPGLPPELDRVVLKALEKNSSRRHLTLRQLLSEIETIAGDGAGADAARARTMYAASGNPTPAPARSPLAATPAPSPPAPGPPGAAPLPHPAAGAGAVASPPRITAQAGTLGGGQAPTKTVQTAPLAPPAAAP